ncbi:MAG: hypothetical protein V4736_02270 [Bdellovibrionota bacterium]
MLFRNDPKRRRALFSAIILLTLFLGTFQNCGKFESQPARNIAKVSLPGSTSNPPISPTPISTPTPTSAPSGGNSVVPVTPTSTNPVVPVVPNPVVVNPVVPVTPVVSTLTPVAVANIGLPQGFGITTENPGYNPFGNVQDKFLSSVMDISNMGIGTLKIYMGLVAKSTPTFYFLSDVERSGLTSMTAAAKSPTYKRIYDLPFKTFFIETTAFNLMGRSVSWYVNFNTQPITAIDIQKEYEETLELAKYFLQSYKGSQKIFVLQNHEGDHHVRETDPAKYDANDPFKSSPMAMENMKQFWMARQRAVNDARAQVASDVKVYHMCEVVRVLRSVRDGLPGLTSQILPQIDCDLIGYSAHEAAMESVGQSNLDSAINYIKSKSKPSADFGRNNVVISEIGVWENDVLFGPRSDQIASMIKTNFDRGMPYILYWSHYDNGCNEKVISCDSNSAYRNLKNDEVVGMWIRKPDGTFGATMKKLLSMYGANIRTLQVLPQVQQAYLEILGRAPSNEEGLRDTRSYELGQISISDLRAKLNATKTPALTNVQIFFRQVYDSIFRAVPSAAAENLFVGQYNNNAIGCYAMVRDLLREDPLRQAASNLSNAQANQDYIQKLYLVVLNRNPAIGDNPTGIFQQRTAGASLESVDAIFLTHPEFQVRCTRAGLRMYPQ